MGEGILGNSTPLRLYYAYGIRNSFGIGFDPVSGNLWESENGPEDGDEINLVEPGFNDGWQQVHGLAKSTNGFKPSDLVDFETDLEIGPDGYLYVVSVGLGKIFRIVPNLD